MDFITKITNKSLSLWKYLWSDVWMKRAMEKLFENMCADDFGEYAGIAQQYIFHYSRMNPQLFEENNKEQNK